MNNENSNIDDIVEENSVHRFNSSYTILNELGRGAFSIVYKVKSIKTGKIYCVKKIRPFCGKLIVHTQPSPGKMHLERYAIKALKIIFKTRSC